MKKFKKSFKNFNKFSLKVNKRTILRENFQVHQYKVSLKDFMWETCRTCSSSCTVDQQVATIKENIASSSNNKTTEEEIFANISWSEEVERADEERLAAAGAVSKTSLPQQFLTDDISGQQQRGGILQIPAHLMNQTKELAGNNRKEMGKRGKNKGFKLKTRYFYVLNENFKYFYI